jgi:hypothetical protein
LHAGQARDDRAGRNERFREERRRLHEHAHPREHVSHGQDRQAWSDEQHEGDQHDPSGDNTRPFAGNGQQEQEAQDAA